MFPSTIASVGLVISRAIESYGVDPLPLFVRAGLNPERLNDPDARFPYSAVTRLWNLAARETGDEYFGLATARFWHPTTFHAVGYSWLASDTLAEGLQRLERYCKLITSAAHVRFLDGRSRSSLTLGSQPGVTHSDYEEDAAVSVILNLCRTTYGAAFKATGIELARATPADPGRFEEAFAAVVQFDAPQTRIGFDAAMLRERLPTGNAELAHANDQVIAQYLSRLELDNIRMRVKTKLIDQLPSAQATQESIARSLNMSLRSLQRRLKEEGVTYRQLLDETRRELAAQYIEHHKLSIGEVTFLLGFSEPSNFSRAFKRWKGVSPSAYRTGT